MAQPSQVVSVYAHDKPAGRIRAHDAAVGFHPVGGMVLALFGGQQGDDGLEREKQKAGHLSGGERQMLAIAMGWLTRPLLMLLDEPSAGLAPRLVTEVFRTLKTLCDKGITIVVVEQNARSVLRWCDYAFILREGRLVFQGTTDDVMADEDTVKNYLGVRVGSSPA